MAGEWIPYDLCLPSKPEVQELIDMTGQGVETVVYRLLQLWGWSSLNTSDGTVRATPERLARICGGDAAFWLAVASVGWLEFDAESGVATIPGWGRRFSAGAKARACAADRQRRARDGGVTADRDAAVTGPSRPTVTRGEENRRQIPPPPRARVGRGKEPPAGPQGDVQAVNEHEVPSGAWYVLRSAWNAGVGPEWLSPVPPAEAVARLSEDGWVDRAVQAIQRLPRCRYFRSAVPLTQFCGEGFVDRVLGGQYDKPRESKQSRGPEDRPAPQPWSGVDARRYEATLKRIEAETNAGAGP